MPTQKNPVGWKRPLRQSKTMDGYGMEMVRVLSSTGPKDLGAVECSPGLLRVMLADGEDNVGLVEVDTQRHQFHMTLAGHPDPVLRVPGETARVLPGCRLGLVGLTPGEVDARPVSFPFPAGAYLVLVSRGVLDVGMVTRGEAFGVKNLLAAIDAAPSASHILKAVNEHLGRVEPENDLMLVVIARTVADAAMETCELPLAA